MTEPGRGWARGCACCARPQDARQVNRRRFLTEGIAAGAALGLGVSAAAAQAENPRRIDVHHHLAPPRWIADVVVGRKTGQRPLADWTPQRSIEDMDRGGVATSIVSISEPSVWFGDNGAARALARECNEYAARLVADHPGRFGQFAILPLPDVEGSLREIEYAFDTLHADGICLMTSYQSKYLGDPAFAPVMDELNRRKAVVFTHPARPDCCRNLVADVAEPVIELATDTTRTVASILFSGTATRCPDIKFIWSHGGGTVPFLTMRLVNWANARKDLKPRLPDGPVVELKKFYYDIAQAAHPYALSSLLRLVSASQLVFGTDFPFVSAAATAQGLKDFGLSEKDLAAIDRGNAARLLPRLRAG
jgi:predicted TIM-barrel fold metal-dependent hydrolase